MAHTSLIYNRLLNVDLLVAAFTALFVAHNMSLCDLSKLAPRFLSCSRKQQKTPVSREVSWELQLIRRSSASSLFPRCCGMWRNTESQLRKIKSWLMCKIQSKGQIRILDLVLVYIKILDIKLPLASQHSQFHFSAVAECYFSALLCFCSDDSCS